MIDTEFDWWYPKSNHRGRRFAYDLESNGLLPDVDTIHSLVLMDLDTEEIISCASKPADADMLAGFCPLETGLKLLQEAELAIGHNVIGYDAKVLKHLYPWWEAPKQVDTLVLSKMLWPAEKLKELDFPKWRRSKVLEERGLEPTFPGKLIGAHKLEAWGYRLGQMKGDYSDTVKKWSKVYAESGTLDGIPEDFHVLASADAKGKPCLDPWLAWNKPMQDYCEQDVRVTVEFLKLIMSHLNGTAKAAKGKGWSPRSVALEHRMWAYCEELKERGFGYDVQGGVRLAATLKNRKGELERTIQQGFGSWWQILSEESPKIARSVVYLIDGDPLPDVSIPRFGKNGKPLAPYVGPPKAHYSPDAPFTKIERMSLNPGSLKQLGDRLIAVYGWQPTDWVGLKDDKGKGTQAKLDESVIKEMEESIIPQELKELLLEFMVVRKTLGQLADGKKAWNSLVNMEDHRLHGRVDPLGTVTHRGAHSDPNLGQVPGVTVDEEKDANGVVISKSPVLGWKGGFGVECRSLFQPGIRTRRGAPGFTHQTGIDASGLQLRCLGHYLHPYDEGLFAGRVSTPGVDIHAENAKIAGLTRKDAKTWIYAWLFGAGNLKLGAQLGVSAEDIERYSKSRSAASYQTFMKRVQGDDYKEMDRMSLAFVGRGAEVSKKFIDAIVGLKELKEAIKAEAEQFGFIIALDGRKIHIRKPHASLNSMLMSAEAIITKNWLLELERLLGEEGLVVDEDYGAMVWCHDEVGIETFERHQELIGLKGEEAMRNVEKLLGFQCPLATDAKHGHSWYDTH